MVSLLAIATFLYGSYDTGYAGRPTVDLLVRHGGVGGFGFFQLFDLTKVQNGVRQDVS